MIFRLGRHQQTLASSVPGLTAQYNEYGFAMVVADGIGATGAGEVASRLAIETLVHLVLHFGKWNLRIDDQIAKEVMERAEKFYRHIDSAVVHRQRKHASSLQTTLTATFGAGRDMFFAHVGHSRAYLFRGGRLMRLTRDHTIGRGGTSTVDLAPLVDVNRTARDLKHILTDTIGMRGSSGPRIDLERFTLDNLDCVLVCTNGLTDAVEEREIAEMLASESSPDSQCRELVDLAIDRGGEDDVTVLMARYHIPD